jgi:hypothetical protein
MIGSVLHNASQAAYCVLQSHHCQLVISSCAYTRSHSQHLNLSAHYPHLCERARMLQLTLSQFTRTLESVHILLNQC